MHGVSSFIPKSMRRGSTPGGGSRSRASSECGNAPARKSARSCGATSTRSSSDRGSYSAPLRGSSTVPYARSSGAQTSSFPAPSGGGQGGGLQQRNTNCFQDAIRLLENIVVPQTEYPKVSRFEPRGALLIFLGADMLASIDFDDQLGLYAREIDDIATQGNLASEAVSAHAFSP